jgi:hypothetical protein
LTDDQPNAVSCFFANKRTSSSHFPDNFIDFVLCKVPDWEELHHMANSLAKAVFEESGGIDYYKIGTASDIQYTASGGSDDWARGVAGIKWVYLIELPGKGFGFLLPPRQIRHVARTSLAGLNGLLSSIAATL